MRSMCENGQESDSVIALYCNFGEEDDITSSYSLREKGSNLIQFILGRGAWYLFLMPIWMIIADYGQRNLLDFAESEAMRTPLPHKPLGKITHRRALSDIAMGLHTPDFMQVTRDIVGAVITEKSSLLAMDLDTHQ